MFSRVRILTVTILVILALFTRFYRLNWSSGHFPHPDENNMGIAVSRLSAGNLNPEFFAYGQFPLYLAYFSLNLLHLPNNFANSIYALRFESALFSFLSLPVFYLLARRLFKKELFRLIFLFLLIFNPGLIQLAHFGTTESLLIFVFALNLYFAFRILETRQVGRLCAILLFSSLITSVGLASKISSLIFIFPVLLSLVITHRQKKLIFLLITSYYLLFTICFYILLSPYNVIKRSDFLGSMRYETAVATGKDKVFYTNQYLATTPYLFQLTNIFPYTSGLPVFIFGLLGFCLILKPTRPAGRHSAIGRKSFITWAIVLTSGLIYFLYFGSLYAKWTRFMSPIFFTFPLLCTYFLSRFRNNYIVYFLVFVSVLPGLSFTRLYFQSDIRVVASRWLNDYLPAGSQILSEAGNVNDIPYINEKNHQIINFDFYNLDSNQELIQKLPGLLEKSNYIIVPSRRMFGNQMWDRFPYSNEYYTRLFSGDYGFTKIKEFRLPTDFLLNSENAEETWSVFDHPTIRVFQKL